MNDFNPYKYQKKLLDEYADSNEKAKAILMDAIKEGHQVVLWTHLPGPYVNRNSYFISNGLTVNMVEPASLHWMPDPIMWNL